MRKTIKTLLAAAAMAVSCAALPSAAMADSCTEWQLPTDTKIHQDDGWTVRLAYGLFKPGHWGGIALSPTAQTRVEGDVFFHSVTTESVKFTFTHDTGGAGVYSGSIDEFGFVSGVMVDRWNPRYRTYWHMRDVARCVAR